MQAKNRRRHFFIKKPLQLRYMAYFLLILTIVLVTTLVSVYYGIWGGILKEFSNDNVQNIISTAVRIQEYDAARTSPEERNLQSLRLFKETELLSNQQRDICSRILISTNRDILIKIVFLMFLIGWGSIFLSHKIAGPLYRFERCFDDVTQGKLNTRVHLRRFDEARELVPILNQMVETLDKSVHHMKKLLRETSDPEKLRHELRSELAKYETTGDK
ncbi:MAG: methyl-accepting chemotaxis protein [Candidatus Omnitrophica bacterium]|nr:methyl-accepting chemotaxis protein [Candidatus Omnitrophota bacterium]